MFLAPSAQHGFLLTVMDAGPLGPSTYLSWPNVSLAFGFIIFNSVISWTFELGVGASLVTAAVRCVVQLTLVATILSKVFETDNGWAIAGIACELRVSCTSWSRS